MYQRGYRISNINLYKSDSVNFVVDKENKAIKELTGENRIIIREAPEEACVGVLKAAFCAKRKKISLGRLLK